jgi:uncharacterized protein
MRIVIAGGSGLIGRALVSALVGRGHEVTVLSRAGGSSVPDATVETWDGSRLDETVLTDTRAVVNLSGASLGSGRWSPARKQAIVSSRVDSTKALVDAIGRLPASGRPRVYVSASGIGFAGDAGDAVVDETAQPGDTFLASVCAAWERAALEAETLGLRVVLMRTAVVLAPDAPAFRRMTLPFRLFAGGRLGSGRQWLPWIHLDDVVRLYVRAIDDEAFQGPVHAVAPEQVRQAEMARALGKALHRPALVPTPAWALRLALGEQAQLVLESQRAVSRKLDPGAFRYPRLEDALAAVVGDPEP